MEDKYINVKDLNRYLKIKIENDEKLKHIFIRGEISNFKNHTRGHLYLTLKDEESRVKAVMFAGNAVKLNFVPQDGMRVLVEGRIGVYEPTGEYQVYIESMEQDGIGNLYQEFEKLKQKLALEGLFKEDRKRPIPKYPRRIGIITASTGAAVKDIISTIKRRYPVVETILFPTLVQGDGAKEGIAKQIEKAQEYDLDVIICGRGGGSIEDLWAFNEEIVARAIFNSKIPIISAVGHEVDYTIADLVADLRAPTPTGAAEMAVPSLNNINNILSQYRIRLNENIENRVNTMRNKIKTFTDSYILKNPLSLYEIKEQKLDNNIDIINKTINRIISELTGKLELIKNNNILRNPENLIIKPTHEYSLLIEKLELLNPLAVLDKGYSVVKKDNKIVKEAATLNIKDKINIKLYKGEIEAIIERIN